MSTIDDLRTTLEKIQTEHPLFESLLTELPYILSNDFLLAALHTLQGIPFIEQKKEQTITHTSTDKAYMIEQAIYKEMFLQQEKKEKGLETLLDKFRDKFKDSPLTSKDHIQQLKETYDTLYKLYHDRITNLYQATITYAKGDITLSDKLGSLAEDSFAKKTIPQGDLVKDLERDAQLIVREDEYDLHHVTEHKDDDTIQEILQKEICDEQGKPEEEQFKTTLLRFWGNQGIHAEVLKEFTDKVHYREYPTCERMTSITKGTLKIIKEEDGTIFCESTVDVLMLTLITPTETYSTHLDNNHRNLKFLQESDMDESVKPDTPMASINARFKVTQTEKGEYYLKPVDYQIKLHTPDLAIQDRYSFFYKPGKLSRATTIKTENKKRYEPPRPPTREVITVDTLPTLDIPSIKLD